MTGKSKLAFLSNSLLLYFTGSRTSVFFRNLFIYLFIYLFAMYLSIVYLSIYLFMHWFIYLITFLFIFIWTGSWSFFSLFCVFVLFFTSTLFISAITTYQSSTCLLFLMKICQLSILNEQQQLIWLKDVIINNKSF